MNIIPEPQEAAEETPTYSLVAYEATVTEYYLVETRFLVEDIQDYMVALDQGVYLGKYTDDNTGVTSVSGGYQSADQALSELPPLDAEGRDET